MQVRAPWARMVRDQRARAGRQLDAFAQHFLDHRRPDRPSSRATRSRNAGSKAISPRMARSVMAATWAFRPTIVGEFVDAFLADHGGIHVGEKQLLAAAGGRLHHDVDRCAPIAARTRSRRGRVGRQLGLPRVKEMSAAIAVAQAIAALAGARATRRRRARQRVQSASDAGIRGDQGRDMSSCRHDDRTGTGGAYCRADRERQVGAGACGWPNASAAPSSMPIRCRSIAICASSPRAPAPRGRARAPHRLYGHVDAAENYSTGRWLRDVAAALDEARAQAASPILVGGTGLYFKALTAGLAAVPPVPADIRAASARPARSRGRRGAACGAHAARSGDRAAADGRTTARASPAPWKCSRRPAARSRDWHRDGLPPLLDPGSAAKVFLACEREALVAPHRCAL